MLDSVRFKRQGHPAREKICLSECKPYFVVNMADWWANPHNFKRP
jgi:hypothetical protein